MPWNAADTFQVPEGTTFTIHNGLKSPDAQAHEAGSVAIGCGVPGCTNCRIATSKGATLMTLRPSGNIESYTPGKPLKISRRNLIESYQPSQILEEEFCRQPLCVVCTKLDIFKLTTSKVNIPHHATFNDLRASAVHCPLCTLFLNSLLEPESFQPDDRRSLVVRGSTKCLTVAFPCIEEERENIIAERCSDLQLFIDSANASNAALSKINGRIVRPAEDISAAKAWLDDCVTNHSECCVKRLPAAGGGEIEQKPFSPTRLIDVGPEDGSQEPFLDESEHRRGAYLTLSYRWGDPASVTRTTQATIEDYKRQIKIGSLCKTFQDAITITRKLGERYIWIDSICIIQDSHEDKVLELARMADIYENALLTISASITACGNSGVFYPRVAINTVVVPLTDSREGGSGQFFVSDRVLSTFEEDVLAGSLSTRGWCLQERILPHRILHFGQDQSHWECSAGMLSENSSERRTRAQFTANDDAGDMRQRLTSDSPLWEASNRAVTSREPHGSWYRMIETYTKRQLTEESDKLPAISGVARRFAAICNDAYVGGLWANDLPAGLMWSATGFLTPYGTKGHLPRPAHPRAPTWSWASVDGAVHYLCSPFDQIHLEAPAVYNHPVGPDPFGAVDFGMFEITGHVRALDTMFGFRKEDAEQMEEAARRIPPIDLIRADYDDPEAALLAPVVCLLVATRAPGGPALGYGLLLHHDEAQGVFKRVGLAQVWPGDFAQVEKTRIRIV